MRQFSKGVDHTIRNIVPLRTLWKITSPASAVVLWWFRRPIVTPKQRTFEREYALHYMPYRNTGSLTGLSIQVTENLLICSGLIYPLRWRPALNNWVSDIASFEDQPSHTFN